MIVPPPEPAAPPLAEAYYVGERVRLVGEWPDRLAGDYEVVSRRPLADGALELGLERVEP